MTLDQLALARNGGKRPGAGIPIRDSDDLARINREWRRYVQAR